MRSYLLIIMTVAVGLSLPAHAEDTIKIGDIDSYTKGAIYSWPYRKGWQLALEEINNSGGVLGKKIEVLSRDDKGEPGEGARVAQELILRDNVSALMGNVFSHITLAVSEISKHYKTPYIGTSRTTKLTGESLHKYVFRMTPSFDAITLQMARAIAKAMPGKKWAVVASNFEGGHDGYDNFKKYLQTLDPSATWVGEQWPALNQLKVGPTIQAILAKRPEALFILLPGGDAKILNREGVKRGLFKNREVVAVLVGWPEEMAGYGSEYPQGWYTTGYPAEQIKTPEGKKFLEAYKAKYGEVPKYQSLYGYITLKTLAKAIEKAGSADREKIRDALEGIEVDTPIGRIKIDPKTHQSNAGVFVGRTALIDGKPAFVDYKFYKGDAIKKGEQK